MCASNLDFQDVNGEHVVSLRELVPERQKDGVVMVTFTDMGYIDSFYLSNELSSLSVLLQSGRSRD